MLIVFGSKKTGMLLSLLGLSVSRQGDRQVQSRCQISHSQSMIPRSKSAPVFYIAESESDSEDEIDIRCIRPSSHIGINTSNAADKKPAIRSAQHTSVSPTNMSSRQTSASEKKVNTVRLDSGVNESANRNAWFASLPRNFDLSFISDILMRRETPTKAVSDSAKEPFEKQNLSMVNPVEQDELDRKLFELQVRYLI